MRRWRIRITQPSSGFWYEPHRTHLDIDGYYTHVPSYSEFKDAANLKVDSTDKFILGLAPMMEIGCRLNPNHLRARTIALRAIYD